MTSSILDEFSADELAYELRRRGYVVLRQQDVRSVIVSSFADPCADLYADGRIVEYVKDELGSKLGLHLVRSGDARVRDQPYLGGRRLDAAVNIIIGWPDAVEATRKVIYDAAGISKG